MCAGCPPHARLAWPGVLFAVLFGVAIALIHTALPEGAQPGAQWVEGSEGKVRAAAVLMPFAGICFLWFIGVVRDGLGHYEDRFFATVFFGSGLLFLAMIFNASAIGAGLAASGHLIDVTGATNDVAAFGQMALLALTKTYAIRMAAVFMISLATIWLKTGLVSRGLVIFTYVVALTLLVASDVSVWLTLAFPVWVLIVSVLALSKAGLIDLHRDGD